MIGTGTGIENFGVAMQNFGKQMSINSAKPINPGGWLEQTTSSQESTFPFLETG